jgi:hypothetical protein
MNTPQFIIEQSNKILEKMENDNSFNFSAIERASFYRSFGQSNISHYWDRNLQIKRIKMSQADLVYSWLGILTASKVKSVWENANLEDFDSDEIHYLPTYMLNLAKGILQGVKDANDIDNFNWTSDWGFQRKANKPVYYAMMSAKAALYTLLHGTAGLSGDFASNAVVAFAGIDENEPGAWWFEIQPPPNYNNSLFKKVYLNHQKEIFFWKWWLTDAISQAWELAQQSTSQ